MNPVSRLIRWVWGPDPAPGDLPPLSPEQAASLRHQWSRDVAQGPITDFRQAPPAHCCGHVCSDLGCFEQHPYGRRAGD